MKNWGPADWSVVIQMGFFVLVALVGLLSGLVTSLPDLLDCFRKTPPSDPKNLVPYRRPNDRNN